MTTDARDHADRLAALLHREHGALADFLLELADFDRRRAWADLGHASLWVFLRRDLGLSPTAAFQRKAAAELLRRYPGVEAPLRDGRLCMSSMAQLARVLDDGNAAEVLPRFFRLSAREAKEVVAELRPRPVTPQRDVVTAIGVPRKASSQLPTSEVGSGSGSGASGREPAPSCASGLAGSSTSPGGARPAASGPAEVAATPPGVWVEGDAASGAGPVSPGQPFAAPPLPTSEVARHPPDGIEPLDADLRRLHLTVSRRFLEKLESLRLARSHARPSASTADLLEEAVDLMLAREAKRRAGATSHPRAVPRPTSGGRVPAHVRRYVWDRDGGCCRWPMEGGGVCGSKLRLEIDHIVPRARGGPSTPGNLRLLCGFHNAEAARRSFGDAWMAQFGPRARAGPGEPGGPASSPAA